MLRIPSLLTLLLCLPLFATADNLHGLSESHYQFIQADFNDDGQADTFALALARKKNKHHYVVFADGQRQKIKAKIGG